MVDATIEQQIGETRQDISSAKSDIEGMRQTASQQTLRAKTAKTVAGGRSGTMAQRAGRKAEKVAFDKYKSSAKADIEKQEESFEVSVAKGVPELATQDALSKVTTEAKSYILKKIDYLKKKVERYKKKEDKYDDKNNDYLERKYGYYADNYEAELKSWEKALKKDTKTLVKEYFTGYTKDMARYQRRKEEARNDYKMAKWKGEKAQKEKIAELEKKGYTPQIIQKYKDGNPTGVDLSYYNKGTGDWQKVASYKTIAPVDVSKLTKVGYTTPSVQKITVGGKDYKYSAGVGVYKSKKDKYVTPYKTAEQVNQVKMAMAFEPQKITVTPTKPSVTQFSSMSATALDQKQSVDPYKQLYGADYKAVDVKDLFSPKPLPSFTDKIVLVPGPATVEEGDVPAKLVTNSYAAPEYSDIFTIPADKTLPDGSVVSYAPTAATLARRKIDLQIATARIDGKVAKISSGDLALAAGVDASGNKISGRDYLRSIYPDLLAEKKPEFSPEEKERFALADKYKKEREKELKEAGVISLDLGGPSDAYLAAEGLAGDNLFVMREDPYKQGTQVGLLEGLDLSGKKITIDQSQKQLVPYRPVISSKEGYFEQVTHTVPQLFSQVFLGQGPMKELALVDKVRVMKDYKEMRIPVPVLNKFDFGGYRLKTQQQIVQGSTRLREMKDKQEQLYLTSINLKRDYSSGKIDKKSYDKQMNIVVSESEKLSKKLGTGELAPSSLVNQYFTFSAKEAPQQMVDFTDWADTSTERMVSKIDKFHGTGSIPAKIGRTVVTAGGEFAKFGASTRYDARTFGVGVAAGVLQVTPYMAPAGAVIMGVDLAQSQAWQASKTTKTSKEREKAALMAGLGLAVTAGGAYGVKKSFGAAAETGARAVTGPVGAPQSFILSHLSPGVAYGLQESASSGLVLMSAGLGGTRAYSVARQTGSYAGGLGIGVGSALPLLTVATAKASPLKIREIRIPKPGEKQLSGYEKMLDKLGKKTGTFRIGKDKETVIQLFGVEKTGYVTKAGKIVESKAKTLAYVGTGFEKGREISRMSAEKARMVAESKGFLRPFAVKSRTPQLGDTSFKIGIGTPDIRRDIFSMSTDIEKGAVELGSGLATSVFTRNLQSLQATGTIPVTRLGALTYGKKLVTAVGEVPPSLKYPERITQATKHMPEPAVKTTMEFAKQKHGLVFGSKSREVYLDRTYGGYGDFKAVSRGSATPESIFTPSTYSKIRGRIGGTGYDASGIFTAKTAAKIVGRQDIKGSWALTKTPSDIDLRFDYASKAQLEKGTKQLIERYHKLGKITQHQKTYDFSRAREVKGGDYQIEVPVYKSHSGKLYPGTGEKGISYTRPAGPTKWEKVAELKGPDMEEVASPFVLGTEKMGAPVKVVAGSGGSPYDYAIGSTTNPLYTTSLSEEARNLAGSVFSVRKVIDPTTGKAVITLLPPAKRLKDIAALSTTGRTLAADASKYSISKVTVSDIRGDFRATSPFIKETSTAVIGRQIGELTRKIESYYPTHLVRGDVQPLVLADFRVSSTVSSPSLSGLQSGVQIFKTGRSGSSPAVVAGSALNVPSPSPSPSRLFAISPSPSKSASPSPSPLRSPSPSKFADPSYSHVRSPSPSPSVSPSVFSYSPSKSPSPSPSLSPSPSPGSPSPSGASISAPQVPGIPIVSPFLARPKSKVRKTQPKKKPATGGYEALVRVKGKYVSLAPYATTKEEAIAIGAEKVLSTSAATFKIVKSSKQRRTTGKRKSSAFGTFFRPSKSKEKGVFVQRKETRISSYGEKREITSLGTKKRKIIGMKSRAAKKKVKKKVIKKKSLKKVVKKKKKKIIKKKGGKK